MSHEGLPPPPEPCLMGACSSSGQKGVTLIAEDVRDRAEHERRICNPDGYRPAACPRCDHDKLHVHQYRERTLRAEAAAGPERGSWLITIVCHRCASAACGATWRILPAFVARQLWRSWGVVERWTLGPAPPPGAPLVPPRTVGRWRDRLASAARYLLAVLATSGGVALQPVVHAVGLDGTREELVLAYGRLIGVPAGGSLAALAALVHRLVPGVRLM